jgi:ribulose-5-phosphate 4-epimerase/fuculose-1-phosphate aldolase
VTAERELRQLVAHAGQVLAALGLVDYLGHASARVPGTDRVVVKPKHSPSVRSMAGLGPDQMIVVDLDGRLVEGQDRPPAEVFIHTEIYRARPDVGAIVHTHQRSATLVGVLGLPIEPVLHVPATFVEHNPPTWPSPTLVTSAERGRALAGTLGGGRFCHLQGHGIVSAAEGVREATVGAAMLEQLAEATLTAESTGTKPRVIPADEIATLRGQVAGVEGRWAYFCQLAGIEEAA